MRSPTLVHLGAWRYPILIPRAQRQAQFAPCPLKRPGGRACREIKKYHTPQIFDLCCALWAQRCYLKMRRVSPVPNTRRHLAMHRQMPLAHNYKVAWLQAPCDRSRARPMQGVQENKSNACDNGHRDICDKSNICETHTNGCNYLQFPPCSCWARVLN